MRRLIHRSYAFGQDVRKVGGRFALAGLLTGSGGEVGVPVGRDTIHVRPGTSDFAVVRQIFRDRSYALWPEIVAERVAARYRAILAAGQVPVIVDAGANIGAAAVWFQRQFPDAAVVAIEPDAGNAAMARHNTAPLGRVEVVEAALGGEAGFVSLVPADEPWAVQTARSEAGCPIVTIADAVGRVANGRLFIAKIDIEGFESDVFAGDLGWLDEVEVVYVEPHDWMLPGQATSRGFQAAFGQREFDLFLRGENLVYVRRVP